MQAPRPVRVTATRRESSRHATLGFHDPALTGLRPGQFVMVWVPGVDEVPMAVWGHGDPWWITVEAKGDATRALCAKAPGDLLGIRGPYGRPFTLRGRDLLLVAGGTGTVPMVGLAQEAAAQRRTVRLVLGGRTAEYLLLESALAATGAQLHVATDDGSRGFHGRAPELAARLIADRRPDQVLACGPERMMRAVAEEAWRLRLPLEASLERWMKCAVGICDACLIDGLRLCRDGPVIDGQALQGIEDFGRHERSPDGRRVPLHAPSDAGRTGRNV